jgi:hypothetical protein
MGGNSDNMMNLGLGGFNALNTSMEYMNPVGEYPDYSTNFSTVDNYLLQIINNLNSSSGDDNQIWIPGVNCINAESGGMITVGGMNSTVPVCPQ